MPNHEVAHRKQQGMWPQSHARLQRICKLTGETMIAALDRIIAQELARQVLERKERTQTKGENHEQH